MGNNFTYLNQIRKEQDFLIKLRKKLIRELEKSPEGSLRLTSCRKKTAYLYYNEASHSTTVSKCTYLSKEKMEFIKMLAQKDYDQKLLKIVEGHIKHNEEFLSAKSQIISLEQVFEKLSSKRKELVTPRVLNDAQYREAWLKTPYKTNEFSEESPRFYTERGERVRSKSEIIIADMLFKRNIPYRYEYPVVLEKKIIVHPDFTILRMRDRKEILWEHFGMMDDMEYCKKALKKIDLYQKSGYNLGEKLLITFETRSSPLETESVQRNISQIL